VPDDVAFGVAVAADAGEILTLQRAAYVTEAQLYDDVRLPALTQSLDELHTELARGLAFKATNRDGRVVGAVRAAMKGSTLHVGRLTVAPDQQGKGIGSALLRHVEQAAPAGTRKYALFTGHLSRANIRLYERHGYREVRREPLHAGVTLVHLEKAA
jgi:ribosomal protein S18 acetylase RimI-like enzyme